jgi:hypothetical protein
MFTSHVRSNRTFSFADKFLGTCLTATQDTIRLQHLLETRTGFFPFNSMNKTRPLFIGLGLAKPFRVHRYAATAVLLFSVLLFGTITADIALAQRITESQFLESSIKTKITTKFEIYNPHSRQELLAVKEMGFTQVILDWPSLHPDATALGLDVVLANWWTHKTPQADIERAIELAKQVAENRLVGISVMDEPQRNSPATPFDFYVRTYNQLRPRLDRELPGVSLEISHWGPLASWDQIDYHLFADLYRSADVMRIMPYPDLFERDLDDVYVMMQRSRALMKKAERDLRLLVILQAWTLPPKSELPTIDELRVMAYQAMLGGAETLSFYHYRPEEWAATPGFHQHFAELMKELTNLSRQFANATIESTMSESGVLKAVLSSPSGEITTIRVNTKRTRVDDLAPLAIQRVSEHPMVNSVQVRHGIRYRTKRRATQPARLRCRRGYR